MDREASIDLASSPFTLVVRWAIVLALSVLLISMATGQTGISNYMELLEVQENLTSVNARLSIENQILEETIQKLKTSKEAQVHYLKGNFGYVERGEVVYRYERSNAQTIKARRSKPEMSYVPKLTVKGDAHDPG